jgi:hypothetical protein
MNLAFVSLELESVCSGLTPFPGAWEKGREDVQYTLAMTGFVPTLADLQRYRALRTTMFEAADGTHEVVVQHGLAKLHSIAIDPKGRLLGRKAGPLTPMEVEALLLLTVDCNGQLIGRAVAS